MKLLDQVARWFAVPVLTRTRIWFAFAVALATDGAQLMLGPIGWVFVDEALDVVAMALTCGALGFHMLLLPTFIIKSIPVADMLPTWTGCTAAVVMLRKRAQAKPPPLPTKPLNVVPPAPVGQLTTGDQPPVPPRQSEPVP